MNEMFITPIQPISFELGVEKTTKTGGQNNSVFKDIFKEAINNVKTTEADLANKQYLLATGQVEDAHTVPIAAAQAQLAADMLVSLRSKALESYNEIMRINV